MKSNSPQSRRGTKFLLVLPVLFAISGTANADPGMTQDAGISAANFATNKTSTERRPWHWKSDPEAYQPDGLSDYSEDFTVVGRQRSFRSVDSEAVTRREARYQTGAKKAP